MNSIQLISVLLLLVAVYQIEQANSQNYHFSNGWQAGKRALYDATKLNDGENSEYACKVRPSFTKLISKLIEVIF